METVDKKPQVSILFFLFSLPSCLGVLYTAALPDLTTYFHATKYQAQETFIVYLIGCLFGQIIYAPIANALGRKPALYIGGALALLGSLLCLFAIETHSFSLLLFGRGLTAFGASCGLILTNVFIADSFTFAEAKRKLTYLMSGFALFPAISITIGGFLAEYYSFKACFYLMLAYTFLVVILCIPLPETLKEGNLSHLKIGKMFKSYLKQLRNLQFFLYACIVSFGSIIIYVYAAEAPFIAADSLHISSAKFGLYSLIPNVGFFIGGITAARLSDKIASKTLLLIGSSIFCASSLVMWLLFDLSFVNLTILFGMPFLIFFATPGVLSNGQLLSLAVSENKAYAASLMYIFQYVWMIVSVSALKFFSAGNASALPTVFSISGALMILFWVLVKIVDKRKSQHWDSQ